MAATKVAFITLEEYQTKKLYELEDRVYNRILAAFRKFLGDKARKFLEAHLTWTVKELSMCSYVDVMSAVTIL